MSAPLIGLIAHVAKPGAAELVRKLHGELTGRGVPVFFEVNTAKLIGEKSSGSTHDLGALCDILVVLGGDGTILQVLHELGHRIKPIFGINLGSLGFLTCVSSAAHIQAVECIVAGNYVLSHRVLLDVEIENEGKITGHRTGLNDAVISRGEVSRLIRLQTRIDEKILTEYNADGLVISTPTGSTAYSLSAGGPILMPDCGAFVITPICPHVLTNRSVIVSDQSRISISPCGWQQNVFLTVDGQELLKIKNGDTIHIRKAVATVPLAMLPDTSFSEILRQKLKWSGTAI